jgi:5-methylcytosine-specific restriction protein A
MPARIERWKPPVWMKRPAPTKEHAHYCTAAWKSLRMRILVRDSYRCRECGRVVYGKAAHVDHIIPLEDGGTDDESNLQTLCGSHHGSKTRAEQRRKGIN